MTEKTPTRRHLVQGGMANDVHAEQFPHSEKYPVNEKKKDEWWDLPGEIPEPVPPVC